MVEFEGGVVLEAVGEERRWSTRECAQLEARREEEEYAY